MEIVEMEVESSSLSLSEEELKRKREGMELKSSLSSNVAVEYSRCKDFLLMGPKLHSYCSYYLVQQPEIVPQYYKHLFIRQMDDTLEMYQRLEKEKRHPPTDLGAFPTQYLETLKDASYTKFNSGYYFHVESNRSFLWYLRLRMNRNKELLLLAPAYGKRKPQVLLPDAPREDLKTKIDNIVKHPSRSRGNPKLEILLKIFIVFLRV